MRLQRLSGMNYNKIVEERDQLLKTAEEYREILGSYDKKVEVLTNELLDLKNRFGDERKSELSFHVDLNISNEDLIPKEDIIITITKNGYAKRMKVEEYKAQGRGGVGVSGMKTHNDDDVSIILPTNTHKYILFFTNKGEKIINLRNICAGIIAGIVGTVLYMIAEGIMIGSFTSAFVLSLIALISWLVKFSEAT